MEASCAQTGVVVDGLERASDEVPTATPFHATRWLRARFRSELPFPTTAPTTALIDALRLPLVLVLLLVVVVVVVMLLVVLVLVLAVALLPRDTYSACYTRTTTNTNPYDKKGISGCACDV
jgi:hypothetical protein